MHHISTACGSRFYVSGPLPLSFCSFATFGQLHTAYGSGEGRHYFDRATLAFFGSTLSSFRMVSGTNGAGTIERQRKAPAGMRFRVELWVMDSAGLPDPLIGCSHATEAKALACIRATFAVLSGPACGECGKPADPSHVSTASGLEYAWCGDCFATFSRELNGDAVNA